MKFLLDEGVALGAAGELRDPGQEATHVIEAGIDGSTDKELLALARSEGYIIVTFDSAFHQMLALEHAVGPSVIRIRDDRLTTAEQVSRVVLLVATQVSAELAAGAIVSVTAGGLRVRRLPLAA